MPARRIELTPRYARFVSQEVKAGRYRDEAEVMQAGLRMLESAKRREEQKLKTLRAMVKQGIDEIEQGKGIVLHGDDELRQFIRRLGKEASRRVKERKKLAGHA